MTDVRAKKAMQAAGQWNEDGVHRAARAGRHDCGAWVIAGLDDPRCAIVAVCDLAPLSSLGEALALIAGRPTYALSRRAGRYELDHRSDIDIRASPPGRPGTDVLAAHRCGSPPLPSIPSAIHVRNRQELPHDPPF